MPDISDLPEDSTPFGFLGIPPKEFGLVDASMRPDHPLEAPVYKNRPKRKGPSNVLSILLAMGIVLVCLVVAAVIFDREWIDYKIRGCQCPKPVIEKHRVLRNGEMRSAFVIRSYCKGHPYKSRLMPKWLWMKLHEDDIYNGPEPPPPPAGYDPGPLPFQPGRMYEGPPPAPPPVGA